MVVSELRYAFGEVGFDEGAVLPPSHPKGINTTFYRDSCLPFVL